MGIGELLQEIRALGEGMPVAPKAFADEYLRRGNRMMELLPQITASLELTSAALDATADASVVVTAMCDAQFGRISLPQAQAARRKCQTVKESARALSEVQ